MGVIKILGLIRVKIYDEISWKTRFFVIGIVLIAIATAIIFF